ncbi:TPA: hypothetical protein ACGU4A_004397 [Vibrio vulnificus]
MGNDNGLTQEEMDFLVKLDKFVLSDSYLSLDYLDESEAQRLKLDYVESEQGEPS